jgi:acyl carrier protein
MDWLNVLVGLHERFGVDIPEADYARLTTLNAIVAYLSGKMP